MEIKYAPAASKQFSQLDKPIQSRIKKYMNEIALLDNPRSRGKHLLQICRDYGDTVSAITAFCAASVTIH